jgi:predicted metal-dependent HD superfamily phosphohydrolase
MDMDLSIFAAPREEYQRYTENIRKEYQHYSDKDFCQGRKKVMQSFLPASESEFIFASPWFREKYESTAIANINFEIESLSSWEAELN